MISSSRLRDPVWARPALAVLLVATGVLYVWGLGASGWANSFYSAAVQAGAHSWKAFFFGSSDASNFITVDKTPLSLWPMELSARLFGVNSWSILVPQALMGVATVAVLYAAVRRSLLPFGVRPAAGGGLLAGAIMATTPVAALMFRFNNPDALLVLLLTIGAYALLRAQPEARTSWLLLASSCVGLGFLAKMLQAFLVVPAFGLVYLLTAPTPLRRRLWQLALSGFTVVVSAGWWVAVVAAVPASSRPYIGGSQHNSVLELALGYNGLGRLNGDETGGLGNTNQDAGWLRMFDPELGGQIAWLLPAALVLLLAALWIVVRRPGSHGRTPAYSPPATSPARLRPAAEPATPTRETPTTPSSAQKQTAEPPTPPPDNLRTPLPARLRPTTGATPQATAPRLLARLRLLATDRREPTTAHAETAASHPDTTTQPPQSPRRRTALARPRTADLRAEDGAVLTAAHGTPRERLGAADSADSVLADAGSRTDRGLAALLLWGGWLLVTDGVFSLMQGIFHGYYTVALAPPVAALAGIGATVLWLNRRRPEAVIALAGAVALTAWWCYRLLGRTPDFVPWLRLPVLVGGLLAAVALLAWRRLPARLLVAGAALAVVASLAGPAAYAIDTATTPEHGAIPTAGPSSGGPGGMRGPGRFPAGARGGFPGGTRGGPGQPPGGGAAFTGRGGGGPFGGAPGGGVGGVLRAADGRSWRTAGRAHPERHADVVPEAERRVVHLGRGRGPLEQRGGLPARHRQAGDGDRRLQRHRPGPEPAPVRTARRAGKIHYYIAGVHHDARRNRQRNRRADRDVGRPELHRPHGRRHNGVRPDPVTEARRGHFRPRPFQPRLERPSASRQRPRHSRW